ncbi:G5 domain-containing protein [Actinoplanes sp. KI2]|uniref:G5 domain-containing protein n=1 Tax=Actinoplanes sp. KI2 TaxID=2983315 RepID=UPI0021D58E38|nr:G5 domain-containing protein [Actinoplanes sp. KI2]MCU7726367.1 G5 domain-containing protein [Actinoplanes sp. KI2]
MQRVGLLGAALLLPLCGGTMMAGALTGSSTAVETPAAERLAGVPAARDRGTAAAEPGAVPTVEATTDAPTTEPTAEPSTEPAVQPKVEAVVSRKTVTVRKSIAYATRKVDDDTLAKGKTRVRTPGVAGVRTLTYKVTLTGGRESGRTLVRDVVTKQPVTEVVAVGTKVAGGGDCDPNYTPCVPVAGDVDCAGGGGDGPAYVQGPVYVTGDDIYHLDRDGDGVGCDH